MYDSHISNALIRIASTMVACGAIFCTLLWILSFTLLEILPTLQTIIERDNAQLERCSANQLQSWDF